MEIHLSVQNVQYFEYACDGRAMKYKNVFINLTE